MSILIKSAKIIDASSKFNGKTKDIFIKQGIINSLDNKIVKKLKNIGHKIKINKNAIGGGQCIKIDRKNGVLIGGSDPRKDGMAIGY